MKIEINSSTVDKVSDASLVIASRGGDRQAFGMIVSRYQRLLCSLAYSALGNLSESEDLAQESFIEAWKKLESLKEPEKMKSWLCGILRFKISHHRRKEARQPVRHADELSETDGYESNDEPIENMAMKGEEQALLWQALEAVPETYRETLILYYREHRSVEHVACELDLSEDAVKQRLSRGRKLLQEKMMSFVEGALSRSTPGPAFTAGVLAALAGVAPTAKAAGCGATAAKVGTAFKWSAVATFLASISGLISSFFALRASLDQSRTDRERRAVLSTTALFVGSPLVFCAVFFGVRQLALGGSYGNVVYFTGFSQFLVIGFTVGYVWLTARLLQRMRALRTAERSRRPEQFESPDDQVGSTKGEYRSRFRLLGFPLIHVKLAMAEENDRPAVGWIAAGDRAYGLLIAWGGFAVAPFSVGIVSFGIVTVGAVGFGVVGAGMIGVGVLGLGTMAIGYKAYSAWSSLGWQSAWSNGFSIANEGAVGPMSFAEHVNNYVANSVTNLAAVDQYHVVILSLIVLVVILPVVWYAQAVRKRVGQSPR